MSEVLTQQTLEKFDDSLVLFIGILGQRFGSPSGTHESGTEEEFEWAFTSNQETGWPEVKWFFRKADEVKFPSNLQLIDAAVEQWKKVCAFRERVENGKTLLFGTFSDMENFREVLRHDLMLWLTAPERPWAHRGPRAPRKTVKKASPARTARGPGTPTTVQQESALQEYLRDVIEQNSYLPLQGVYNRGQLVKMPLDQVYVRLKAAPTHTQEAEKAWLASAQRRAPGGGPDHGLDGPRETEYPIEQALAEHKRLVVLGDPGSGKTTLLRYLALCYARDRATGTTEVRERLKLPEGGFLPVLVLLRDLGKYCRSSLRLSDEGTEGSARILRFLAQSLKGEHLIGSPELLRMALTTGRAVILFDGMDEVGDFALRRRVARLIEKFAARYADCRIVVTSRLVGYTDAALLEQGFTTTTIRDFTLEDIALFLNQWHRCVVREERGAGPLAEREAARHTAQLLHEIKTHPALLKLAINPLILTVIAFLRRDNVKLPEHRAELYRLVVELLVGGRDEDRGLEELKIFDDRPLRATERLVLLQSIALRMQAAGKNVSNTEIEAEALVAYLREEFTKRTLDPGVAHEAAARFLQAIRERSGLLVEAGQGVYRFSHLTFQEYLAAARVAEKDDYIAYTLKRLADPPWREVIRLEAGYLSLSGWERVNRLLRAIVNTKEQDQTDTLLLAVDCFVDVGENGVESALIATVRQRLQGIVQAPLSALPCSRRGHEESAVNAERKAFALRRVAAARGLGRLARGDEHLVSPYWSLPHGEPQWITIPAGEFVMGSAPNDTEAHKDERPEHAVSVAEFRIARTPVTNAQYWLYVRVTGVTPPPLWNGSEPPEEKLWHPVVAVTWDEALSYCAWLSQVTGSAIRLSTEAEWEKAARGGKKGWKYPWGDTFDVARCNSGELGVGDTSPVGLFPEGASKYGCLNMSGNVWEWVQDWYDERYYQESPQHNPQGPKRGDLWVLRGGSWALGARYVRVAYRLRRGPGLGLGDIGFRCAQ